MAIYVGIQKIDEDDSFATYQYGPNEERVGQVKICKESGEIEILSEVPDDDKQQFSMCAVRRLTLHFRENEFPDKTCFAA